jgi:hypothetical protein
MPVYIVQTSAKLNQKELDKALDICQATNCDTICINAPKITDFKALRSNDFLSGFFQAMQGINGANTDVFASIITKQWRKNPTINGFGY